MELLWSFVILRGEGLLRPVDLDQSVLLLQILALRWLAGVAEPHVDHQGGQRQELQVLCAEFAHGRGPFLKIYYCSGCPGRRLGGTSRRGFSPGLCTPGPCCTRVGGGRGSRIQWLATRRRPLGALDLERAA